MRTILYDSPAATNLRYAGLTTGFVRKQPGPYQRFRLKFGVLRKMNKWDQKALAARYLVEEYEAKDFEYFRDIDDPFNYFVVEFTSYAL